MVDIVMNVEEGRGKLSPHVQTKCGSATSFSKLNSRQYLSYRSEVVARGELAGLGRAGPMKQAVWWSEAARLAVAGKGQDQSDWLSAK
jgi:hypothetical protein